MISLGTDERYKTQKTLPYCFLQLKKTKATQLVFKVL